MHHVHNDNNDNNTYYYYYYYYYYRAGMPSGFGRKGKPLLKYPMPSEDSQFGRGDDTVGSHRRARISPFELFELEFLDSSFSSSSSYVHAERGLHICRRKISHARNHKSGHPLNNVESPLYISSKSPLGKRQSEDANLEFVRPGEPHVVKVRVPEAAGDDAEELDCFYYFVYYYY